MTWKRTTVDGRTALYGVAGAGRPLVFLHGWALGQHAYRKALGRLVGLGVRVYAPALPGFGGTPDLPARDFTFRGYAAWVDEFIGAVGIDEPVYLVGHSFGGGVAIQTAYDFGERVRVLVLVNSIGAAMPDRALWDWGRHFPGDLLPIPHVARVIPAVLEDAVPNLLRNPFGLWRVAQLARRADLTRELSALKSRQLPVVVLHGEDDLIVPKPAFDAICAAIGLDGAVVSGNHSWLLADPDQFGEVMTNVIGVADVARSLERDEPTG
jgi:pimeloyl-ACP methyl ester carboxylesterase